jgi:L-Ala-D/L-Glu epimerase
MLKLEAHEVNWPLRIPFTISRVTFEDVTCIQVKLTDDKGRIGRGEAVGVDYHGETPVSMLGQIENVRDKIEAGISRAALQSVLPAGGARNAIDSALWDLEAKASGIPAWQAAGLFELIPRPTAFTFGMMSERDLRALARNYAHFPVLKVKTDGALGLDPIRIIHEVAPRAHFIVDPNQAWDASDLHRYSPALEALNVILLEQPVKVEEDDVLLALKLPIPIAADEAFSEQASIGGLIGKYQVLNIKLDKAGGLTEALSCAHAGKSAGFDIMVGCMVGSSLSMAPGTLIAQLSRFVDLDGPLLQSSDCDHPIIYQNGTIGVPSPALWG